MDNRGFIIIRTVVILYLWIEGMEESFSGKFYAAGTDKVLLCVAGGNLSIQNIILDGGVVSEEDFTYFRSAWNSHLLCERHLYDGRGDCPTE